MTKPWKARSTKEIYKSSFFRFRVDECELPDGRIMPQYFAFEFPDWVNIVPVTEDNRIVLVEQYRHAAGASHIEIPGGSTDPKSGEDPKRAVMRELAEETGYVPDDLRLAGVHYPNPALQNNRMHTYVGFGCKLVTEPAPDPFEDLRVITKSIPEVFDMIIAGQITHTIVVASLLYALPMLGFHLPRTPSK